MRIPSSTTDQVIYFVAVDSTDFTTRETGLSSFTVYRSRNGAAAAAMTTPTVTEVDATNMPGVYKLLLDEDMTIGSGNDSEEMVFHITASGMAPVTRTIELYRPKITVGNTLSVEADGDLTEVNTLTGHTAQTGDSFARLGAPAGASVSADIATIDGNVDAILEDTGTDIPARFDGIEGATFDTTTDSLEAIRNRGDSAWITATGFSTLDAAGVRTAIGLALADLDTQLAALPTAAEIRAEIDSNSTQLAAILEDTGTTLPATLATIDGIVDAILVDTGTTLPARFDGIEGATFDTATDSLEAIRNRGDSAWITATGFSTLDAAGVRTAIGLASADLDTQLAALPTAAEIRTEIDSNSTQLAAILEDTGTTLPATLATIDGNVDAILVDTGTTLPATLSTLSGYVDTEVAAVKAVTDKLDTAMELDGAVYRFTTNALEQGPSGAGGSAAAVWDYLEADISTSGSIGERLKNAVTVESAGQLLTDALGQ